MPSPPYRHRSLPNRAAAVVCWVATFGLCGLLLFSYGLPQRLTAVDPPYARLATVAFFGRVFTFHAGLALAAIAVLAVCLGRRWVATAAAVSAAVVLYPTAVACLPRHPPPAAGPAVRVMAMNTKYTNRDAADIIAQVHRFNPDLLTVEEFATPVRAALDAALTGDYPYRCLRSHGGLGLALYSRLPFEGKLPDVTAVGVRRQIRAVVRIDGRRVAVYVLHPLSPRSQSRVLFTRFFAVDLADQVRRETLPVVLAGDFNFTAETPNAKLLTAAGLTDAFDLAGRGRGSTWPVRPRWLGWLPGVRIDHIYLSPQLTCTRYFTADYVGSDHLPIVADIAVANAGRP